MPIDVIMFIIMVSACLSIVFTLVYLHTDVDELKIARIILAASLVTFLTSLSWAVLAFNSLQTLTTQCDVVRVGTCDAIDFNGKLINLSKLYPDSYDSVANIMYYPQQYSCWLLFSEEIISVSSGN